jgi:hypothetical protein
MTSSTPVAGAPHPLAVLYRRVASWFRGLFAAPPAPPPIGELRDHRRSTTPITVLALGDAFDFRIYPAFTWRSEGIGWDDLQARIDECTPRAVAKVREFAADLARRELPHRADRLEEALNRHLLHRSWRLRTNGAELTCQPQVTVLPDAKVRESMQPIWARRIAMESEHDLDLRRADLVRERTEAWTAAMEKLQDNPLTAHAALLTEDPFAGVFRGMLDTRVRASNNLILLLQDAIRDHQKLGLYEFAEAYDVALKAFQKQAGLAVPDFDDHDRPVPEDIGLDLPTAGRRDPPPRTAAPPDAATTDGATGATDGAATDEPPAG